MSYFIRIERSPYEEPFHLQLLLEVSNGRQTASLEIYLSIDSLRELADALEVFPRHVNDVHVLEIGTEDPRERWAYYLLIRAFVTNGLGHCALMFRLNNNRDLPYRELAEFCIEAEPANINQLGRLLRTFTKLQHTSLYWSANDSTLD
jgi:hypothetical protein